MDFVKENNGDIQKTLASKKNRYAINMCLVQIGENANKLKSVNPELYENKEIGFLYAKGMRDRIVHGYGVVDYEVVEKTISMSIPNLCKYIEKNVCEDVLNNPYQLYDVEYEDIDIGSGKIDV